MPRPWTVLPHRPIRKLQDNLWAVEADLPQGPLKRVMGIARLADGRLVLFNGVALDEAAMKEIEAWGEPAFVVAPNGYHRIDLGSYKVRYPKLRVLAAPAARAKVAQIAPVDGFLEQLPSDPAVKVEEIAGGKMGEVVATCRAAGSTALVFPGDTLMNVPAAAGVPGVVLRVVGFVGELRVPRLIKWIGVRDKGALKQHLEALAQTPGLSKIVTCHGPVVDQDAAGALLRAAAAL
jgi:hypothetical protein